MHNLKQHLLNTGYFIENEYFIKYINLIKTASITLYKKTDYCEMHHILPRAYFNIINQPIDNQKTNLVELTFRQHCLAHWYLSYCTIEPLRYANQVAFLIMVGNAAHNKKYKNLTEDDVLDLAEKALKMKLDLKLIWTESEDTFLINNFKELSDEEIARQLGRKIGSIVLRRTALGLQRVEERNFTEEEHNLIISLYPTKTVKEIAALLNRCPNSISAKKQRLNLRKYTEDYVWKDSEIALLKQYATTKSLTELSILLNRTKSAIKNYCHKHHIKCRRTDLWPEADKQFIKENYANMTAKQIAAALNRSYHSVIAKIHLLLSVGELKRKTNKS